MSDQFNKKRASSSSSSSSSDDDYSDEINNEKEPKFANKDVRVRTVNSKLPTLRLKKLDKILDMHQEKEIFASLISENIMKIYAKRSCLIRKVTNLKYDPSFKDVQCLNKIDSLLNRYPEKVSQVIGGNDFNWHDEIQDESKYF